MTTSNPIDLFAITPNGGRPKGFVPYRPRDRETVGHVLDEYQRLYQADALPAGPRQAGYRLKERYPDIYTKASFPAINDRIKRLTQDPDSGLPIGWMADASEITYLAQGWASAEEFLADVPDLHKRHRQQGQSTVNEIVTEAKETLPLIHRVARVERGVNVYSGSGSIGPGLACTVPLRALQRAVEYGQNTKLWGICDFDLPGIRNILRPHIEHVAAFIYGTSGNDYVLSYKGQQMSDTDCTVTFEHLALTPQMALGLVDEEADRQRIAAYIASGDDIWSRDLDLLDGVQKIEQEALDPVDLRNLVIAAIDGVIDTKALNRVAAAEKRERTKISRLCDPQLLTPAIPPRSATLRCSAARRPRRSTPSDFASSVRLNVPIRSGSTRSPPTRPATSWNRSPPRTSGPSL